MALLKEGVYNRGTTWKSSTMPAGLLQLGQTLGSVHNNAFSKSSVFKELRFHLAVSSTLENRLKDLRLH